MSARPRLTGFSEQFASEPGSVIEQHGVVRFEPKDGVTRVDVKMSYRPIAGAVGHAVARLFGADPRSEMIAASWG